MEKPSRLSGAFLQRIITIIIAFSIFLIPFKILPIRVAQASIDDLQFIYDDVLYESVWPIERWIKRGTEVVNTGLSYLELEYNATCLETGYEISPFPQPSSLYLDPGENQTIWYFLDVSLRTGLTNEDMEVEGNYTRTVAIRVWLRGNPSDSRLVYLNHLIRVVPSSWYTTHTNSRIYGYVYDEQTKQPLKDVHVEFCGANGVPHYGATTNQQGYYEMDFFAYRHVMNRRIHEYVLTAAPPGYEAFMKAYWPVENSSIRQDVYLERTTETINCTLIKRFETNMTIYRGAVTSDEKYVVFSQGHCELPLTQEEVQALSSVLLFDTNGTLLWRYPTGGEVWGVDISDDGSYVAAVVLGVEKAILLHRNGTLLWDTLSLGMPRIESREVQISHNDKYVALGSTGGTLYLMNLTTGEVLWTQFLEGQIRQIAFNSDDSHIYAGSGDGYLYILGIDGDIITRAYIEAWPYSTGGLKLTEDEAYVATASKIGNITLIGASNGERLWTFDTEGGASWVDVSPNRDFVIEGDGGAFGLSLFDLNGTLKWWMSTSHSGMIANDGKHILVGREWGFDIINPNGTLLWRYWENFSHIPSATFTHVAYISKNQSIIVIGHGSGAVYFWRVEREEVEFPDFTISSDPSALTFTKPFLVKTLTSDITVAAISGFSEDVTLSLSWVGTKPRGVSVSISPTVVNPGGGTATAFLTVRAQLLAPKGTYTLRVTGTVDATVHTIDVTIVIA